MKILLLAGGISNEREISQRSGDNIEVALRALHHEVVRADPANKHFDLAKLIAGVDMVFPILHGEGGEDGVLQAQLETLHVPFLGADSNTCVTTFDKVKYKELLAEHGILTPSWQVVTKDTFAEAGLADESFVLKPIKGGSSIDTYIVHNPRHQTLNYAGAFKKYGSMLLEELIEGQEITVGVLGNEALPVVLIVPPAGEEFDYENKYNGKTQEIANPKEVLPEIQRQAQVLAVAVHKLVGCRHMSRTDIIVTPGGVLYVLETNTIPGLTAQSLLPKAAAAREMAMTDVVKQLVALIRLP